jgi:hypothetical protein
MNLHFLSSKNDPSGIYPTFVKGGRGDLRTANSLPAYKSTSVPLCESGMTPIHEHMQIFGDGGAA